MADAELNKMLIAQRRELDPKKRLAIVHDIQRYLADKAYYVYLPYSPQYITHAPQVKGMKYHDGFSLGYRLMFTWLDKWRHEAVRPAPARPWRSRRSCW